LLIVVIIYLEMARTYRRKTKRGCLKMDYIMAAVRRVKDGDAIRKVDKKMNIDESTSRDSRQHLVWKVSSHRL